MMQVIDNELLIKAERGDVPALAQLDEMGFLLGDTESPQELVSRIRTLLVNIEKMEHSLASAARYTLEDITVSKEARIPASIFEEASQECRRLYGFSIHWVPGFFINPSWSLFFGGCAFYYYPDFFAMFIIRESFKTQQRWLIYNRKELLSHELCHIARLALLSNDFEETFAYQTSTSAFRRLVGGIFLRQSDSLLFIGSAFLVLLAQMVCLFWLPSLPPQPFFALPVMICGFLTCRYLRLRNILKKAFQALFPFYKENTSKVLFRCSDSEIRRLAAGSLSQDSLHWQVIRHRFQ